MGCLNCGKKGGKPAPSTSFICAICNTDLHCKKKDVCRIGITPVCGQCMRVYKKGKVLEKVKEVKKNGSKN